MSKPEAIYKDGGVEVAVLPTEIEQDGETVKTRTYRVNRRYLDADGHWQTTDKFSFRDLCRLHSILAAICPKE